MNNAQGRKEKIASYKQRTMVGGIYSITNTQSKKKLLCCTTDLRGSKNRFDFSVMTDSCVNIKLKEDWNLLGDGAFVFEVLEEVTQKETQTEAELSEEVAVLRQLWEERIGADMLY